MDKDKVRFASDRHHFGFDRDRDYSMERNDHDSQVDRIDFESKFNMYERQIDQLFDFSYRSQDDIESLKDKIKSLRDEIKTLFKMKDDLGKCLHTIENKYSIGEIPQLKICIQNYYQLELENKRRMEYTDCYQFQLFIVQIIIIVYLVCLRFALV